MKTKILTVILTFLLLFQFSVNAVENVDYSDELTELENLLNECEALGIPTDYEQVNYSVLKRFESLINDDIANYHPAVETNIAYMDELYEETKINLEAYIAGEKHSYYVNRPDMLSAEPEGSVIYSDSQPVFSVGYGHFLMARNDIEKFSDFGVNNIQIEIGPNNLTKDFYGWTEQTMGSVEAIGERVYINGDYAMYITNNTEETKNVYLRYYQKINCTPNTKYKLGCFVKGDNLENIWVSANNFSDRHYLSSSPYWKEQNFYFTSGAEQTELVFSICSEGITKGYLDDFYIYEIDESGNVISDNLIANPGLEDDDCYSLSTAFIKDAFEKAEENNVGVCLLLSPHYFPADAGEDVYDATIPSFIKYNIHAPKAKEIIENYLRTLLPRLKGEKALESICLSNEPTFDTRYFYDFYNPLFREYLKEIHGNIASLNEKYQSEYADFEELDMPEDLTDYDAICYDWIEFNDKMLADWHKWMAGIVKEYLPDIPLHSKMMGYFSDKKEDAERSKLTRGTDLEYFDEFSDYAGNDTWDFMNNIMLYYNTMFLYDYQMSVTNKPVYNSEDHIVEDRSPDFSVNQRKHLRNNLWMGAAHGRSMSTVWVWDKSTDKTSALYNSIAYRPDVTAEAGRTSLDLMRYSYEMARIQQEKPKVALFYSKPSRLYNENYSQKLLWSYISLLNMGEKVGIVSDNSIDLLSNYEVLVIPEATNCKINTLNTINEFIKKGGKVIYTGNVLSKDEYNRTIDNSAVISAGDNFSSDTLTEVNDELYTHLRNCGLARFYFVDEETGKRPENLDWQYSIEGNNVLLTVTNLEYDDTKKLAIYADGERLIGFNEYFTEQKGIDTITLEGYTPQLISLKIPKKLTQEIDRISVDTENSLIKWNYRTDKYFGASVYSVSEQGERKLIGIVRGNEYKYSNQGTYLVCAMGVDLFESNGRIITVSEEKPFEISCSDSVISKGGVSAQIQINNIEDKINSGVVYTVAYDLEDNVVGYSYNRLILNPYASDSVKVMFTTDAKAEYIKIFAADSAVSKNLYSNVVTKNNVTE